MLRAPKSKLGRKPPSTGPGFSSWYFREREMIVTLRCTQQLNQCLKISR